MSARAASGPDRETGERALRRPSSAWPALGCRTRWRWALPCLYLACACAPAAPAREPDSALTRPQEQESAVRGEPASPTATAPGGADLAPDDASSAAEGSAAEGSAAEGSAAEGSAATASSGGAIDLDGGDDLDADIAALSKATATPESQAPGAKGDELSGREIVYRVTPQGLVIEVGGIHLRPVAKGFRDPKGNYGVDLQLTAESFDNRQYWLSKPAEGPMSIAGRIEAPSGKRQRFADERRGDREEVVRAGEPRKFKQRWPGKGQPKLRAGETLTLEVGLWGVHADEERERPVRRLFEVKLVGAQPPQAVISPPTLDWGS